MKKPLFLLNFLFCFLIAHSQDTLTVMQYNLLNYGNYTSYCTSGNNNHEQKDLYLKTITGHVNPHIFTVNEISQYEFYHNRILNEVLNIDGKNHYRKAALSNIANSYIINQLYYDSRKLVLHSQSVIQSFVRDINLYRLYYRGDGLTQGDTIFINCIVVHLKAGTTGSDKTDRATMTASVMNWLNKNTLPGNFLIMGDFNVYSSTEDAYQNLIAPVAQYQAFRFYDPIDKPGNWNKNYDFAKWHTQSVSSGGNGCQSGGGMDDRFDFILASSPIMQGEKGITYIAGSYEALGQDGRHFNRSINDQPQNTSVPAGVLNALAYNSDHLPVILKLKVNSGSTGLKEEHGLLSSAYIYSGSDKQTYLCAWSEKEMRVNASVFDISGKLVSENVYQIAPGRNDLPVNTAGLYPGFYLLNFTGNSGKSTTLKLVLQPF